MVFLMESGLVGTQMGKKQKRVFIKMENGVGIGTPGIKILKRDMLANMLKVSDQVFIENGILEERRLKILNIVKEKELENTL